MTRTFYIQKVRKILHSKVFFWNTRLVLWSPSRLQLRRQNGRTERARFYNWRSLLLVFSAPGFWTRPFHIHSTLYPDIPLQLALYCFWTLLICTCEMYTNIMLFWTLLKVYFAQYCCIIFFCCKDDEIAIISFSLRAFLWVSDICSSDTSYRDTSGGQRWCLWPSCGSRPPLLTRALLSILSLLKLNIVIIPLLKEGLEKNYCKDKARSVM